MKHPIHLIGIYNVPNFKNVVLIEFKVVSQLHDFDIEYITQEITNENQLNWQSPYDEKYLDNSNRLIGDWIDKPKTLNTGNKILFFFHELQLNKPIRTQYGDVKLNKTSNIPFQYLEIMIYEQP